jgi:enolase
VPGEQVVIALDVAAAEIGRADRHRLALDGCELDSDGLIELLLRWIDSYPIISIEDTFAEDVAQGFVHFTRASGHRPIQRRLSRLGRGAHA